MKKFISFFLLPLVGLSFFARGQNEELKPIVDQPIYFDVSPPLRDLIRTEPTLTDRSWKSVAVKNYFDITRGADAPAGLPGLSDPSLQPYMGTTLTDTTITNFAGIPNVNGSVPPDTDGDVGLGHYFQVVNTSYAIFNKMGTKLLGPLASSSIWSGMPNNVNSGDAIVLYDEQANRWFFSQFSLPSGNTNYIMIAVSQTPDPMGSWYRYQYSFTTLPDYPKFAVWPDGYYMSCNRFTITSGQFAGAGVYAYDRAAMLVGNPTATRITFQLSAGNEAFALLPSDCDGAFPPAGTPNYFSYIVRTGTQHLGVYEFHADYVTPGNSTFGNKINLNVSAFSNFGTSQAIPQMGTTRLLDPIEDRLMNRLQYRKFPGYASMVVNHTVKSGTVAGIRWYELRKVGSSAWTIAQQSTYAPSGGKFRWMGSMSQDSAGNMALGYSISSSTSYPSVSYTGRLAGDPLNQMTIAERRIIIGSGSQTGLWDGRSRWGDYSSMRVDPANPTTFWYTQEYYATTSESGWVTRIASFSFEDYFSAFVSAYPVKLCVGDSSQLDAYAYGGSGTYTYEWTSDPPGFTSALQSPKVGPTETTKYMVTISDGTQSRTDSVRVTAQPRQFAFAGNDTTVNKYVPSIELHGVAYDYRVIGWISSGDGYYSDPSALNTIYYPGGEDRNSGSVDLKLVALPIPPCTGNLISTMHVTFDEFIGIQDPSKKEPAMTIQPNPARGMVTIVVSNPGGDDATLIISDIVGRAIMSAAISTTEKQVIRKIDVSAYPKGIYLVQLKTGGHTRTERLIVQ